MAYKIKKAKKKEPKVVFVELSDDKKWIHKHYTDGGETIEPTGL